MMNQKYADTEKPMSERCREEFFSPLKKREVPIRYSFWTKSTKWVAVHTEILLRLCWRYWTLNKTILSTTIIWSKDMIYQKYSSSLLPTTFPTFRCLYAIVW